MVSTRTSCHRYYDASMRTCLRTVILRAPPADEAVEDDIYTSTRLEDNDSGVDENDVVHQLMTMKAAMEDMQNKVNLVHATTEEEKARERARDEDIMMKEELRLARRNREKETLRKQQDHDHRKLVATMLDVASMTVLEVEASTAREHRSQAH